MDEKLAKIIGTATRAARQARGLTQDDAAEAVGISSEFYSRVERGKTLPSVPTLVAIASALDVSADLLLGLDDAQPRKQKVAPVENRNARLVMRRLRGARASTIRLVSLLLREVETSTRARERAKR